VETNLTPEAWNETADHDDPIAGLIDFVESPIPAVVAAPEDEDDATSAAHLQRVEEETGTTDSERLLRIAEETEDTGDAIRLQRVLEAGADPFSVAEATAAVSGDGGGDGGGSSFVRVARIAEAAGSGGLDVGYSRVASASASASDVGRFDNSVSPPRSSRRCARRAARASSSAAV